MRRTHPVVKPGVEAPSAAVPRREAKDPDGPMGNHRMGMAGAGAGPLSGIAPVSVFGDWKIAPFAFVPKNRCPVDPGVRGSAVAW
jgi:hypothetical protein